MFLLEELRKENGLKRSELARQLKINQNTLANYEKELRQAPYDVLIQIADYFSVSVDELLCRNAAENTGEPSFSPLSKREKELVLAARRLKGGNLDKLEDYLELLLSSQK